MLTSVQMQMCMRMLACVLAYLHATVSVHVHTACEMAVVTAGPDC